MPCALLIWFEYTGFGGDRDAGIRIPALAGYAALTLACFVVSVLLVRWLAPHLLEWALGAYVGGVFLGVLMLGIFA